MITLHTPPHLRLRRLGRPATAAALLLSGALPLTTARADGLWAPPPLPAQNGTAAAPCTQQKTLPGTWNLVTAGTDDTLPSGRYEVAVDPFMPCRMYRAPDPHALERSTDGGQTWQQVFHDQARGSYTGMQDPSCATTVLTPGCALSSDEFTMRSIAMPSQDTVILGENGNGDAVVASDDTGRTWGLRDSGIAGEQVSDVRFAPSDAHVAYAVVKPENPVHTAGIPPVLEDTWTAQGGTRQPSAFALDVTTDAGRSWSRTKAPPVTTFSWDYNGGPADVTLMSLQIDPQNPARLWALYAVTVYTTGVVGDTQYLLAESTDSGQTWTPSAGFVVRNAADIADPVQLVVTRSARHPLRLFVAGFFGVLSGLVNGEAGTTILPGTPTNIIYSDDDGSTWTYAPVPYSYGPYALAADPLNGDRLLFVSNRLGANVDLPRPFLTDDGFDTPPAELTAPGLIGPPELPSPLVPTRFAAPDRVLQADRFGNFYLAVDSWPMYGGKPRLQYWEYVPRTHSVQPVSAAAAAPRPSPPRHQSWRAW